MNAKPFPRFIWKATVAHIVTYTAVGLLAYTLFDYTSAWSDPAVDQLMRPTDDPLSIAGPLFQVIRGVLFALFLYPLYDVLFNKRRGWLLLWGLMAIFSGFNTVVPGPGSLEGMIYTALPMWFHVVGYPELIIQTLLFAVILYFWVNRPDKKWISIVLYVLLFFAILFPILGLVFSGAA